MPPPRAKLYKSKAPTGPPSVASSSNAPPTTGLSPEQERQFETELCWCIQQLQIGLSSNKLNNKQVQDHTKALNTLMSNTAPLVKKRQIMRLSFGDYRAKMITEEKKAKALSFKVSTSKASKKSLFLKKAMATSGSDFKFDFPVPTTNIDDIEEKTDETNKPLRQFIKNSVFNGSDNSFRFNFVNEENKNT
ncbi:UPF0488 protein CG14286 [Rhynchophorus ferrugineus]|uniref:UPF0488 protein CG14286 n=1 Tax=Rhynchophorus ferrugineus TaxID=354439 RepID=UPI003FCC5246